MLKINKTDTVQIKLNKIIPGYDAHCLRSLHFFPEKMPDIVKKFEKASTKEEKHLIVNSIKSLYKEVRQESKGPTFALT